ncbi:PAP/OAS1 substrate-binding domain superfamily [Thalictrum thalictroides]|uniref:PAP/OAS1 substrate-binding domain superfamily n=1 Tax=Thalictrum thalictroides TaxID=46969 RepID=A0A7J6URY7_THATH|nr:PAP/OAS1 substrate-binding domain superfamily [Thalictrum thalictroides]
MGDLEILSIQPNGFMIEEDRLFSPPSPTPSPLLSNPSPTSISEECWQRAEQTAQKIIRQIQPTIESEERRKGVIEHVQNLIKGCLGSEVFPFGSVPLKTYLPDGDIDLTALSIQTVEDSLANDVRTVLEREEKSKDADFEVKDVQYIHAEVKLIKCLVQNIVVDISFNQLGGLCTLCFLEQVDRLIGKDHLFKRSIILIKAWCYYESRVLGAHHGLISTYALETMVLYIFHLFHSSLDGPLAVLYRFLDYYSKFDWDCYCISLNGPVSISSLPEIVAETPDNDGGELLLDKDFLGKCVDMFSVPSRGLDATSRSFPQKHFNIVDPLKENNNLGRSVSKGNFYRIRSAFTYGARKLGQILLLTAEDIPDELNKFFMNTLDRHGSGQRPDVHVPAPTVSANESDPASLKSALEKDKVDKEVSNSAVSPSSTVGESQGLLQERISGIHQSESHRKSANGAVKERQRCTTGLASSLELLERFGYIKENGISGCRLVGNAEDHATSRISDLVVTMRTSECLSQSHELATSPLVRAHHAPHLYLNPSSQDNGNFGAKNPNELKAVNSVLLENKISSRLSQGTDREVENVLQNDFEASKLGAIHKIDSCGETSGSVGKIDGPTVSSLLDSVNTSVSTCGSLEAPNSLSDLSGDYDSHIKSLLCAQWCQDHAFSVPFLSFPSSPSQFQDKHAFDVLHQPMQLKPNMFPHVNANGVFSRPHFFPVHPPMISAASMGMEEASKTKHRGTGTYFPNLRDMNQGSYKERGFSGRRSVPPVPHGQLYRALRDNNCVVRTPEMHFAENGRHEPLEEQFPALPCRVKPISPEFFQDNYPASRGSSYPNGYSPMSGNLEFGCYGQSPSGVTSPEACRQPVSIAHAQKYPSHPSTVTTPRPRPALGVNVEGSNLQAFHLRNEADFPSLARTSPRSSK